MENKKIKTAEYQSIEKSIFAKNLDKFIILKLRNKNSNYKKLAVSYKGQTK